MEEHKEYMGRCTEKHYNFERVAAFFTRGLGRFGYSLCIFTGSFVAGTG